MFAYMKSLVTLAALVISALLLVLAIGFTVSTLRQPEPTLEDTLNELMGPADPALIAASEAFVERLGPTATPEEIVAELVKEVRATTEFPEEGSEYETWTGIRGDGRVVVYSYDLFDIENIPHDEASLKGVMTWWLCGDPEVQYMLDAGVVMAYEYSILDTGEQFTVSVTERDCAVE